MQAPKKLLHLVKFAYQNFINVIVLYAGSKFLPTEYHCFLKPHLTGLECTIPTVKVGLKLKYTGNIVLRFMAYTAGSNFCSMLLSAVQHMIAVVMLIEANKEYCQWY